MAQTMLNKYSVILYSLFPACNCDPTGSVNNICDHQTGQCLCKPGIGNRNCGACLANHYQFSAEGCLSCDCNPHGSINQQCNAGGACTCFAGVGGTKCDQCEGGSFGLPDKACESK